MRGSRGGGRGLREGVEGRREGVEGKSEGVEVRREGVEGRRGGGRENVSLIKMLPKYYRNLGDFQSILPKIINHNVTKILPTLRRFSVAATKFSDSFLPKYYRKINQKSSHPVHII